MKRLLVATRSLGKQAEFRTLLAPLSVDVVFPDDIGLTESAAEREIEAHDSFAANARAKARWFRDRSGLDTLADDSGLEVDALGGAPGVHSKRFAGVDGSDQDVAAANTAELLARLAAVPDEQRTARYCCVLVLSRPRGDLADDLVVAGVCPGRIVRTPSGTGGFGYDPVFFSDELGQTFGEAAAGAKDMVSHRARAVGALIAALRAS